MAQLEKVICGNIVLPNRTLMSGYVGVKSEKIVCIGSGELPSAQQLLNYTESWILPGVIDGQVHSSSQLGQEGLKIASRAAAAGGVTTMVEMPYDDPAAISTREAFEDKANRAESESLVDVALYATILDEAGLQDIDDLIALGACGFKFSTFEAAPGRFPRVFEDVIEQAMLKIKPYGLPIGVHNQIQDLTLRNIERLTKNGETDIGAFLAAHTELIENLATSAVYEIGAMTGARAHVVHVSTGRGFELHEMYRNAGHSVSIETCIQYLMVNHEEHATKLGALVKHYPPIRRKEQVDKLWEHIAQGNCTFVSSDHVSWSLSVKGDPNIFKNKSGGPGLETLLPAFWTGCQARNLSPQTVARLLSEGPAEHFLLRDRKGAIEVGLDADLVVLEPKNHVYSAENSQSAVSWSMFDGFEFSAKVAATFSRGEQVWDGTKVMGNHEKGGRVVRPNLKVQ
ncbi:dihydroorotase family protein [Pelagibius sp. Alg239-R121]|uniref:dihydroorotase n=1 Tax=Pelagibius sp. Alg239-R121 TaxID=2993448 RepID=UPI0024A73D07|nr:amidohydrolase family protein [Pelagibius sp. Alg239-R121]